MVEGWRLETNAEMVEEGKKLEFVFLVDLQREVVELLEEFRQLESTVVNFLESSENVEKSLTD